MLALLLPFLLVASGASPRASGGISSIVQTTRSQAHSVVDSVDVISAINNGAHFSITIHNLSDHKIRALTMGCGIAHMTEEFIPPTTPDIEPGGNFTFDYLLSDDAAGQPSNCQPELLAVLFDNGRIEGDPVACGELRDLRRGQWIEMRRELPIVKKLEEEGQTGALDAAAIRNAAYQISSAALEDESEAPGTGSTAAGIQSARTSMLMKLTELRQIATLKGVAPDQLRRSLQEKSAALASWLQVKLARFEVEVGVTK